MPLIDIVTMRGMVPRVVDHLLPDEAATLAQDCHFDRGVVAPLMADKAVGSTLPIIPKTLFHYYGAYWFAWNKQVEVMRSPIAQDQYNRVYFTDGEYPKLTYDAIATGGTVKPTAWYRLGVPAPATPPNMQSITPPAGGIDEDPTDDETRFYVETYVTGLGEEGAPGPASGKVTVTIPGSSVVVGLSPVPTNNSNITRRRLYRSVSGGGLADYLLVAELPIAAMTYNDSKRAVSLGRFLRPTGMPCLPKSYVGSARWQTASVLGLLAIPCSLPSPICPMHGQRSTS
ncbi:hypothetical protein [Aeromonas jandaei]|uniref:hypothetical protein n=1 Tax=Aeromonas jandaei TaxID=650 RepID=UPI003EC580C6